MNYQNTDIFHSQLKKKLIISRINKLIQMKLYYYGNKNSSGYLPLSMFNTNFPPPFSETWTNSPNAWKKKSLSGTDKTWRQIKLHFLQWGLNKLLQTKHLESIDRESHSQNTRQAHNPTCSFFPASVYYLLH